MGCASLLDSGGFFVFGVGTRREMDVEDMKGDKTPTSSEKEMRDGRRVVEVCMGFPLVRARTLSSAIRCMNELTLRSRMEFRSKSIMSTG